MICLAKAYFFRNRRRREREKNGIKKHNEGLSSDDEETTSQRLLYKDTIGIFFLNFGLNEILIILAAVLEKASNLFIDTVDEFCNLSKIISRFIDWHTVHQSSYDDAYISLCLTKIIAPFIRLELLDWIPLQVFYFLAMFLI